MTNSIIIPILCVLLPIGMMIFYLYLNRILNKPDKDDDKKDDDKKDNEVNVDEKD